MNGPMLIHVLAFLLLYVNILKLATNHYRPFTQKVDNFFVKGDDRRNFYRAVYIWFVVMALALTMFIQHKVILWIQ